MPEETPNQQESPLKQMRQRVGLTQAELARRIGVSDRAVRAWEKGEYPPTLTIPQIRALCKELQIAFEELPNEFGPAN